MKPASRPLCPAQGRGFALGDVPLAVSRRSDELAHSDIAVVSKRTEKSN